VKSQAYHLVIQCGEEKKLKEVYPIFQPSLNENIVISQYFEKNIVINKNSPSDSSGIPSENE